MELDNLDEALITILEADQQTVEQLDEGIVKDEVVKIRRMAEEMDDEQERDREPQPDKQSLGYANDLHSDNPDEHRMRSDPFTDNRKTANWLLGTMETALARTDIAPEQLRAVADEAIRRHGSASKQYEAGPST